MSKELDKEFVPYQESLELKELGFDELCFSTYNSDKKVSRNPSHDMEDLPIEGQPYYWQNSKIHFSCITAPTYSQAFRFFREKYGLRIRNYGSMNYSGELSEYFEIFKYGYGTSDKSLSIEVGALTYEQAELACLKKLIEIVKQ